MSTEENEEYRITLKGILVVELGLTEGSRVYDTIQRKAKDYAPNGMPAIVFSQQDGGGHFVSVHKP